MDIFAILNKSITSILNSDLRKKSVFLVFTLFVMCVGYIGIHGNFPINDDWIFQLQVKSFTEGDFNLSSLVDPSFISQGFIAYFWAILFGYSFESFRFLTFFITLLAGTGFYYCLSFLSIKQNYKTLFTALFLFNPIIFTSTFTFMTENYFALFAVWSIYFYLKHLKYGGSKHLVYASLFSALALLNRQFGAFIYGAFILTFVIYLAKTRDFSFLKNYRLVLAHLISAFLVFGSVLIWLNWPSYADLSDTTTRFGGLILPEDFRARIFTLWWVLPYLGFFTLPLLPALLNKLNKKLWLVVIPLGAYLAYLFYTNDVFPMGNIYYLEGLYTKSNFRINLSLLDNLPLKLFLSIFNAYYVVVLLAYLLKNLLSRRSYNPTSVFLLLNFLLLLSFVLYSSDYYERYLLPSFIPLMLLASIFILEDNKIATSASFKDMLSGVQFIRVHYFIGLEDKIRRFRTLVSILLLGLIIFSTVSLNHEYMTQSRIRYSLADKLAEETGLLTEIQTYGPYGKYQKLLRSGDYSGIENTNVSGNYKCFVQKYTLDTGSKILYVVGFVNNWFSNTFGEYKVPGAKKDREIPRVKNNIEKLMYEEEYYSILYNPVGKRAFVGAWCDFAGI